MGNYMQFRADIDSNGGSKNFLKLKDKESVTVIFRGEPHEFYIAWENNKSKIVEKGSPRAQFRFRINVILKENGTLVSKVWEQGATVYNMLRDFNEEVDLEQTFLKISRNGEGKQTSYTLIPTTKTKMTKELQAQIDAIPLQALEHKEKPADGVEHNLDGEEEVVPF